ncbi:methyltransferase domain-containing protein [Lentisphaerota bacterium ZTH]|nr:methyltransferase domain-containing protein [Lentisphaerota bacterium]WET05132.1 methyltransferase domain-containing protein [Lentisphaerota bacterium ZTH]
MRTKPEDKNILFLTESYCCLGDKFDFKNNFIELDLGCGKGSFTTQLGIKFPDHLILAADIMIGRLRKLQKRNEREKACNIQPIRVEARHLVAMLPDNSLDRLHILCPDPWPKDKHRANRLMCSDFMAQLHRVMKTNGHFHFSTDDMQYHDIVRRVVAQSGLFKEDKAQLSELQDIKSDFELRWNSQGKEVHHFLWVAKPLPEYTSAH